MSFVALPVEVLLVNYVFDQLHVLRRFWPQAPGPVALESSHFYFLFEQFFNLAHILSVFVIEVSFCPTQDDY